MPAHLIVFALGGCLVTLMVVSREARSFVGRAAAAVARVEREHHLFSGAAIVLASLAAIVVLLGALVVWALGDIQFG